MERGPDPHLNPPTSSPSEFNTRGLLRRSSDEFLMKEDGVVEKCGYQGSQKMQSFSSSRNLYLLISALLGYNWYIKNCTYLMHAFWWIWTHTYTCETISAIWVISISVTSKCFLVTSFFFFFFFFMVMLVKLGLYSLMLNRNAETVLGKVEKNGFVAFPGKGAG